MRTTETLGWCLLLLLNSVWRHWALFHKHSCTCTQAHMYTHALSLCLQDYSEVTLAVTGFLTRSFQTLCLVEKYCSHSWKSFFYFYLFFFLSVISFVFVFYTSSGMALSASAPHSSLFCGHLFWVILEPWIVANFHRPWTVANFHGNFIIPHKEHCPLMLYVNVWCCPVWRDFLIWKTFSTIWPLEL